MEPAERLVEAYLRIVKRCLTISNVYSKHGRVADLLGVDRDNNRFHIEVAVSSDPLSEITNKQLQETKREYRQTMNFFVDQKFNNPDVAKALETYGFKENYKKIIVTWNISSGARTRLKPENINIWYFHKLLSELFKATAKPGYFSDEDRLLQLIGLWIQKYL